MRIAQTSDLWWKNAVIYCLDPETFYDDAGNGTGDFGGLIQRVDYLSALGVNCIWLMPFYPSPERDDGYDVTDFFNVDPRLGTLGDVVEFIRTAKDRGMRVIADFVINHTSDKHPWFVQARKSVDNPYRHYYVWRSDPPPDTSKDVVFPGEQDSIWTKDEATGEWYLHRFMVHQPDLNISHPQVRDEIAKAMGFWLQLGLDGFRLDAVPFFLETIGEPPQDIPHDPHEYLRALRRFVNRRSGEAIFLGEVNLPYKDQLRYFGDEGDELTMMFDFMAMQNLYVSLAKNDARPLARTLSKRPPIPGDCQWAMFVRNHDELTLDKLSEADRQAVFEAFGPEEDMQLYGRGLRRRLPTMLDGDQDRIRMVYSLLFTLPGTPTLFYGEEIGMGENLDVPDRGAVRTPMQWTDGKNAGFSDAPASKLVAPMPEGRFGPEKINAANQMRDPDSLWHFVARLIQRYRDCPELGWGTFEVLKQPAKAVLLHASLWQDSLMLLAHNFGPDAVTVRAALPDAGRRDLESGAFLLDLLGDNHIGLEDDGGFTMEMKPYGYRWFRLQRSGANRLP